MKTKRRKSQTYSGCGFLLLICLVACFLLTVNIIFVQAIFAILKEQLPEFVSQERVVQAVHMASALGLMVVEFWVYDWLLDRLANSHEADPETP